MKIHKPEVKTAVSSIHEAVAQFRDQGYPLEFLRSPTHLYCPDRHLWIRPEQFIVEASYYLENASNPGEDRAIYVISSNGGLKGTLVEACGVYSDTIGPQMAKKLSVRDYQTFRRITVTPDYEKLAISQGDASGHD